MDVALLQSRLDDVRRRIAAACAAASRDPQSVRLLAVSKTHPPEMIRAFHALGLGDFGENYAQELAGKARELADVPVRFAFIGTVQSNKIKLIVEAAAELHTLADPRHAQLVAKAALAAGKAPYPVYLSVNLENEATKSGLALKDAPQLAATIARELPELSVQGLMAIPAPLTEEPPPGVAPPSYRELAAVAKDVGRGMLSLGMSQDLAAAIAAGSTTVRVGTALFGSRPSLRG